MRTLAARSCSRGMRRQPWPGVRVFSVRVAAPERARLPARPRASVRYCALWRAAAASASLASCGPCHGCGAPVAAGDHVPYLRGSHEAAQRDGIPGRRAAPRGECITPLTGMCNQSRTWKFRRSPPWSIARNFLVAPISGVGVLAGGVIGVESCSGQALLVMFWPAPRTSGAGAPWADRDAFAEVTYSILRREAGRDPHNKEVHTL